MFSFKSLLATDRGVYLSQIEHGVHYKLQLWTLFVSCMTIYTDKTLVNISNTVDIRSSCWSQNGWFVFCDSSMNVYRTRPNMPNPEICVEHIGNVSKSSYILMCSWKNGFILYTSNKLTVSLFFSWNRCHNMFDSLNNQHFEDNDEVFKKISTIVINHQLKAMVALENHVYFWSDEVGCKLIRCVYGEDVYLIFFRAHY